MMQRLRQQRNTHALIVDGQLFELAALPRDVLDAAPIGERLGAFQDLGRSVDADDALRPTGRLDREVPLTAREVRDVDSGQQ
jgi:hypothetical protein